ncbi:MAG TPA: hypothetical protein VK900_15135 [Anaerolineales bacterium]|nr:hypothetical protein [Anaerolineales bacterium]
MNKKILFFLTIMVMVTLLTSTVSAGGNVGLGSVKFSLGSLNATGTFTGLGGYKQGVDVELTASGIPVVTCTNQGGNQAPGQNPPKVSAEGNQFIGPQLITKKGTAPMNVTADAGPITGLQGGCPNNTWSAQIDFVYWTDATISVFDVKTGALLLQRDYACTTTLTSVTCTQK